MDEVEAEVQAEVVEESPKPAYVPGPDPEEARAPRKSLLRLYAFLVCLALSLGSLGVMLFLLSAHLKREDERKRWQRDVEAINEAMIESADKEKLKKQISDLNADVSGHKKSNDEWADKLVKEEGKSGRLRVEKATLDGKLKAFQEEVENLNAKISDLKDQVSKISKKAGRDRKKFLEQVGGLNEKLAKTEKELDASEELSASYKSRYERSQRTASKHREDLDTAYDEINSLKDQIKELQKQIGRHEERGSRLAKDNGELLKQVDKLEKENRKLQEKLKSLEKKDDEGVREY